MHKFKTEWPKDRSVFWMFWRMFWLCFSVFWVGFFFAEHKYFGAVLNAILVPLWFIYAYLADLLNKNRAYLAGWDRAIAESEKALDRALAKMEEAAKKGKKNV